ncbi:right-handed parallel beta-helix repeat-containing protein [bacterium]|nr:right-handed parallel beta-helix repeat-containing protein [bacterium]
MKNGLYVVMACIAAFLFSCTGTKQGGVSFYVSLSGNDSWSGKLTEPNSANTDGPFTTLDRGRNAVRSLKQGASLPAGGVTVHIREGAYPLSSTFTLTSEDSGTESAPVVWCSFNGEKVQLVGGKEITGFKPVTDKAVAGRIDEGYRDKVLVTDLMAQGITDYGEITSRGGPGLELFFKDARMILSRWPNDGWTTIADVPQTGELVFKGELPHMRFGLPVGRHYGRFTYEGDRPKRWKDVDEIVLHGYWTWDWYDEFLKVSSIDTKRREIRIKEPHSHYGYCKEQRYYALNILEELDSPGEWYLDRKNGLLYFWPPEPIESGRAFVSILRNPLISLENTEYVTIRGLNLEFSRGSAVTVTGGSHNLVAGCTTRNLGELALSISGGTNNGITGCDIYDVAAGGITLDGGDRKTLTPGGNYATNNHIHHYSAWIRTYQSAITVSGVGNRVAHNLIHDAPHSGIMLGGNEHIIEFNELHTLAQQTGDVGAFYMGRDWTQRGNIIRYNYFHDLLGPGLHGVMAVYLDDWSSGTTIYGNIFHKAGRAAFIGGGRDNTVENNIFVECAPSAHVDARGLGWAKYYFDKSMDIYVNTLFDRMDAMNFREPPYSERYPELLKLYDDDPAIPKNNKIIRNVSYGGRWLDLYDGVDFSTVMVKDNLIADPVLCKWIRKLGGQAIDYPNGDKEITDILTSNGNMVTDTNPGFVDPEHGNFQLRDDSPAYKLGFKRIPVEQIGLSVDEYRSAQGAVK